MRPLEVVQGLSEVMLEPFSLQLPLSWVAPVLLRVVVEVPQLQAAVVGQLLSVMLNLVPDHNQIIIKLMIKLKTLTIVLVIVCCPAVYNFFVSPSASNLL